jgi:two-component system chemotaxis response regulator CheY
MHTVKLVVENEASIENHKKKWMRGNLNREQSARGHHAMTYDMRELNILTVDDNRYMRFLVKTILHGFGIKNVSEADDGSDALKTLRTFPADIIITDWLMEPLDGIDLVRMVRTASDSLNPLVPIIMLTGYSESLRVQEARDAGVTEFLAKPISARAVYHRLVEVIENPRAFVNARSYTGPCRRRRERDFKGIERRVVVAETGAARHQLPESESAMEI